MTVNYPNCRSHAAIKVKFNAFRQERKINYLHDRMKLACPRVTNKIGCNIKPFLS